MLDKYEVTSDDYQTVTAQLRKVEQHSFELKDRLVDAAGKNQLTEDVRRAVREKWGILEDGLDEFHRKTATDRECPRWCVSDRELEQFDEAHRAADLSTPVILPPKVPMKVSGGSENWKIANFINSWISSSG